jgi:hypothetical protein
MRKLQCICYTIISSFSTGSVYTVMCDVREGRLTSALGTSGSGLGTEVFFFLQVNMSHLEVGHWSDVTAGHHCHLTLITTHTVTPTPHTRSVQVAISMEVISHMTIL